MGTITGVEALDDHDWWHCATVDVDEPVSIEFKGLTFPATVFVDGAPVSECESMFLPVRIGLAGGHHEVCVCFHSLNSWLQKRRPRGRWRSSLVSAAGLRWARATLLGRAPVYGNIPAPVGFWRPVMVKPTRLSADVMIVPDPDTGAVRIEGKLASPDAAPIEISVYGPSGELIASTSHLSTDGRFVASFQVNDRQLWWPRGYGLQPLYRVTVRIGDEVLTDRWFGFRSVSAVTDGGGFVLKVNGVDVFCRGVTWSPPDPVRLTVDAAVMREHLAAFVDAGANMVRVVGGLVYEQDEFWEQCAELGLMVWQDAMQATFDPPDELCEVIVREVEALLTAVSGNPALTVFSGGSETLQRPEMLGIGRGDFAMPLIDTMLPRAVAEHAGVPYVRATPSPPDGAEDLAIRPDSGTAHWFGVGGYLRPVADVRSAGVRFAAECLAFANPPSDAAVERHFGTAAVAGHHPEWKAEVPRDRGSSWDFEDVRDFYVREVFGEDPLAVRRVDPQRYLQLGRLAIAEAMLQCFAFWRRADSGCGGALVLASKDLRPGAGWGMLDCDGGSKAALEAIRRVWAPVAVVLSDAGLSGVRVDLHNDTPEVLSGEITMLATNFHGQQTLEAKRTVTVPKHSSLTFFDSDVSGAFRDLSNAFRFGQPNADGVEVWARFGGLSHGIRDALIVNPRPGQVDAGLRAVARPSVGSDWELEISSNVALRYVSIEATGWVPSDNYFHLLAGQPYSVRLQRHCDREAPLGKVSSVDSVVGATITANK